MRFYSRFAICIGLSAALAHAGGSEWIDSKWENTNAGGYYPYASPNEMFQQELRNPLQNRPSGVYIAVGTDRGLMSAALSPNVTHLLLADFADNIVGFNRVNIALLKIALDREDYLRLRRSTGKEREAIWRARSAGLEEMDRGILFDDEVSRSWELLIHDPRFKNFHEGHPRYHAGVNYLFHDEMFLRLQEMARRNRIKSIALDFKDVQKVLALTESLQRAGIGLSALDLSNAWLPGYIGSSKLIEVIKAFSRISCDTTVLILTTERIHPIDGFALGYNVFEFDRLRDSTSLNALAAYLEQTDDPGEFTQLNPHQIFKNLRRLNDF